MLYQSSPLAGAATRSKIPDVGFFIIFLVPFSLIFCLVSIYFKYIKIQIKPPTQKTFAK